VNLHTKNSISFTKGLVLKKHLISNAAFKSQDNTEEPMDELDEINFDEEKRKGQSHKSPNLKNKNKLGVEYVI